MRGRVQVFNFWFLQWMTWESI
ncbi:hypothetical protein NPIL_204661, partial [Nephila pilipes]